MVIKKKKKDDCFITTATLKGIGVDNDNCYELQEFRKFRDSYVMQKYPNYINEYYKFAPIIVDKINQQKYSDSIYSEIWNNYLKKCLFEINENNSEKATEIYKNMFENLKVKFLQS